MKAKEIHELLDRIVETGLAEVEIETDNFRISIRRDNETVVTTTSAVPAAPAPAAPAPQAAPAAAPAPKQEAAPAPSSDEKLLEIKSPMIGTFYRSSSPEAAPFVEVGQKVEKGSTVCIVEAMKLFNEIESEVSGTIVKVLVDNATPVEYDQVLFLVKP
ncbi:MAG: acetyl-CoA carboxylase biotin carboxyl carrier protein [Bacteroidota bacterium]